MKQRKKISLIIFSITFSLTLIGCGAFTDIEKIPDYLSLAAMTGRSTEGPVPLKVRIDINSNFDRLIDIINSSGVRVDLDLSQSRMTNTIFNPRDNGSRLVTSLVLPNSVTVITGNFSGFTRLARIRFPASAEIRGFNPFAGCHSLTFDLRGRGDLSVIENGRALVNGSGELISFPSASVNITLNGTSPIITAVGTGAFALCENLQSVTISSAEIIRDGAFFGCENLTTVNMPGVVTIGEEAFSGCLNLSSVNFPAAATVGAGAFRNCENLETLNLPAAVTIGNEAFYGNTRLQTLNIPSAVTIRNSILANTGNITLTITMGDKIELIGTSMFSDVSGRKNVTIRVPQDEVANITAMRDAIRGRGWSNGTFILSAGQNQPSGWRTIWVNNFNTFITITFEGY